MHRLLEVSNKKSRIVVGLMSGTSHDGVDAVVARITGSGGDASVEFLSHSFRPYPAALKASVREAFNGRAGRICRLNFELGGFFGRCAVQAASRAGFGPGQVDVVGSHGQTIFHSPPSRAGRGCTLQVGEGAVIARITGALTVTDFRTADVAAGGQGAPLVPFADWILFRRAGEVTALQNVGGIGNVTVVTEDAGDVFGFDTGPGNSLIDEAVRIITSGEKDFDSGGKLASSGNLNLEILDKLLSNPYFRKRPPKSTGRETFGRRLVKRIFAENPAISGQDMLCTLTHLSARSIYGAYSDFVFPRLRPDRVVVSGGGAKNRFMLKLLRGLFEDIPVVTSDSIGIPSQAREPLCFAVLANETVCGNPGSLPGVTGASSSSVLGKISV